MKIFLTLTFFLIPCLVLPAQSTQELFDQGVAFRKKRQLDLARQYIDQALNQAQGSSDTLMMGNCHLQHGRIFTAKGYLDSALIHYRDLALILFSAIGNKERIAATYNNMLTVYEKQKRYDDGIWCGKEAQRLWAVDTLANLKGIVAASNNIANCYEEKRQLDSAVLYNTEALAIVNTFPLDKIRERGVQKGDIEFGLANRYRELGQNDKAWTYYNEAGRSFILEQDEEGEAMVKEFLGELEMELGKYELAGDYFRKAALIYARLNDSIGLNNLYYNYGQLYFVQGKYTDAHKAYQKSFSYFQQNPDQDFFHLVKSKVELSANKMKTKQNNQWMILLGGLLFLAIVFFVVKWLLEKQKALKKQEQLILKEKEVISTQKDLQKVKDDFEKVRHDVIKGSLSAIKNYIECALRDSDDGKLRDALALVKRLGNNAGKPYFGQDSKAGQMRKSSLGDMVREMHNLASKICGMSVAFFEEVDDAQNYMVCPFVSKKLEAIISIAFSNIREHAKCDGAELNFSVDEAGLHISIQDNGVGFSPENIGPQSAGISNIKSHIQDLKGSLQINTAPGKGTEIQINIPYFIDEQDRLPQQNTLAQPITN